MKRKVYSCYDALVVASSRRAAKAFLKSEGYRGDKIELVTGNIAMVKNEWTLEVELVPVDVVASWFPGPHAQIIPEI